MRVAVLLLVALGSAFAHDVPDQVRMRVYLRPAGGRMQAIVRVPINALLDVDFPTMPGTDYLDLTQAEPFESKAAVLWISNLLTIYENGVRLPKATVDGFRLSWDTDPSFNTYASAWAHLNGPKLPPDALVDSDRGVLDVLVETPIPSDRFGILTAAALGPVGSEGFRDARICYAGGRLAELLV